MNRTFKIYIAILAGVIVLATIINGMQKKPLDWSPTYSLEGKNPLDLYVLNREIDAIFGKNNLQREERTLYEHLMDSSVVSNYMIIDQSFKFDNDSLILNEIAKGSNLFVSCVNFSESLLDSLNANYSYINYRSAVNYKDTVFLTLTMERWNNEKITLSPIINPFPFLKLDSLHTRVMGKSIFKNGHEYPNFVCINYGKGHVYFHNQPSVFTNVALLNENDSISDYVSYLFSYLPKNIPTVWLVKGQTKESSNAENRTSLSVIFKYPALRATWLIFLYGLLLFILFNVKRRQRIVPIKKPLQNTTVEFTQTIGNLYYQEGNPANLVQKKIIYFLDRIRNRYYTDTQKLDEKFVESLHNKSGKDKKLIDDLAKFIIRFEKNHYAGEDDLIHLNDMIEKFWETTPTAKAE